MNSKIVIPLIVLLVIVSFLVGTAWNKVNLLGNKTAQASPIPQPQQQAQAPVEPTVLGAQDMAELAKGGVVLGAKDAKVTVVEISDPSCPFCAVAAGFNVPQEFKARNPDWEAPGPKLVELAKQGKIQLVFRYFPGHGSGERAMQAAWCAEDQKTGVFWDYLDLIFENQAEIEDLTKILALASTLNLDKEKINACVQSEKYKSRLESDTQLAVEIVQQNKYETFGTPAFFINGYPIIGAQPYKNFEAIINQALAE